MSRSGSAPSCSTRASPRRRRASPRCSAALAPARRPSSTCWPVWCGPIAGDLSGGEKQRVARGGALLAEPRLLLMDEPLASLDAPRKAEILPFIEKLRDELHLPVIYVSHAMEEIVRLADTLVLMSEGRIAAVGPVEELTSRLDLRPLTGRYEAGAVLRPTLAGHDVTHRPSELAFPGRRPAVAP